MGWLRRLFGGGEEPREREREVGRREFQAQPENLTDEQALERYRYMLRTAPPEAIEQAHEEAFAKLTPEQRSMALQQLAEEVPDYERDATGRAQDDPKTLARLATRAELRRPGTIERAFGGGVGMGGMGGMGVGMGGMFGGSLLSSLAAGFVGSMIAHQLFEGFDHDPGLAGSEPDQQAGTEEPLGDEAGEFDSGGFDSGGDIGGDFGGDF